MLEQNDKCGTIVKKSFWGVITIESNVAFVLLAVQRTMAVKGKNGLPSISCLAASIQVLRNPQKYNFARVLNNFTEPCNDTTKTPILAQFKKIESSI